MTAAYFKTVLPVIFMKHKTCPFFYIVRVNKQSIIFFKKKIPKKNIWKSSLKVLGIVSTATASFVVDKFFKDNMSCIVTNIR